MRLKKYLSMEELEFNGLQLRAHWAQESFGLQGESIIAFVGPFGPRIQNVVFPSACQPFHGKKMLHFVVEHFHADAEKVSLQQLLLIHVLKDKLNHRLKGDLIQRWGQNLFLESAQLTVAMVLLSDSSATIYTGINIQRGDPASKIWGLEQGHLDPMELAQVVMDQYIFEVEETRRPRR